MAGLVQDGLQGEGDAKPEKYEEESAEKVTEKVAALNACAGGSDAERHGKDGREDCPRCTALWLLFLFVHTITYPYFYYNRFSVGCKRMTAPPPARKTFEKRTGILYTDSVCIWGGIRMTDIEIAHKCALKNISEIAAAAGIGEAYVEPYGRHKAKISLDLLREKAAAPDGKLILVTAITPTPAGEGKTTTSIGLTDALRRCGKNALAQSWILKTLPNGVIH